MIFYGVLSVLFSLSFCFFFFFFKQKTAYEMRISDWSSDVCSSDLAIALALFAWLLTLHPTAAGRTYAAYGGMYIAVALLWLRFVDGVSLTRWDVAGAAIALVGIDRKSKRLNSSQ